MGVTSSIAAKAIYALREAADSVSDTSAAQSTKVSALLNLLGVSSGANSVLVAGLTGAPGPLVFTPTGTANGKPSYSNGASNTLLFDESGLWEVDSVFGDWLNGDEGIPTPEQTVPNRWDPTPLTITLNSTALPAAEPLINFLWEACHLGPTGTAPAQQARVDKFMTAISGQDTKSTAQQAQAVLAALHLVYECASDTAAAQENAVNKLISALTAI